jgi:hypothetical protein
MTIGEMYSVSCPRSLAPLTEITLIWSGGLMPTGNFCRVCALLIPTGQLIDSFERLAGWYKLLISRAAAPPSPRAYQSAIEPTGINRCGGIAR